jgi:hypothetical protein
MIIISNRATQSREDSKVLYAEWAVESGWVA